MRLFLILLFILTPATSFAACTPETIQFYLDKGFNQEQITKLCANSGETKPSYQPYQKPVVIVHEGYASGVSADERKAANTLRGGLQARSVDITDTHVNYIRKVCIKWKLTPSVENRLNKCVDVAYSISRENLRVDNSSSGLISLVTEKYLEISSSDIKRKYVVKDPFANVPTDKRYALERKFETFETGNTTKLPLRNTADPSNIVNAIRTIADTTQAKKQGVTSSEVARVLDDSYVPPSEDEYLASQPTYKDIQEEEKKKKKWWNPFD